METKRRWNCLKRAAILLAVVSLGALCAEEKAPPPVVVGESFVDFLERYGVAHAPSMVYRDGQDFRAWQAALRRRVEGLRGPLPDRVAPKVEILETTELSDHTRRLLRFPVTSHTTLVWQSAEPFMKRHLHR